MAVGLDIRMLEILQRYFAGDISAREAAKEMGPQASQHDVFAGLLAARLHLPEPPGDEVARQVRSRGVARPWLAVKGQGSIGLLAQQLATLHPCRAIVCVASAPPWMLTPQLGALPFLIPMMPAIVCGQPIRPAESAFRYLLLHDLPEEEQKALLPTRGGESGRAFRAMMFGLGRLPSSRFTGPVLCLSGGGDRIISRAAPTAIARDYGAEHKVFDAGHWLIAASTTLAVSVRRYRRGVSHNEGIALGEAARRSRGLPA